MYLFSLVDPPSQNKYYSSRYRRVNFEVYGPSEKKLCSRALRRPETAQGEKKVVAPKQIQLKGKFPAAHCK